MQRTAPKRFDLGDFGVSLSSDGDLGTQSSAAFNTGLSADQTQESELGTAESLSSASSDDECNHKLLEAKPTPAEDNEEVKEAVTDILHLDDIISSDFKVTPLIPHKLAATVSQMTQSGDIPQRLPVPKGTAAFDLKRAKSSRAVTSSTTQLKTRLFDASAKADEKLEFVPKTMDENLRLFEEQMKGDSVFGAQTSDSLSRASAHMRPADGGVNGTALDARSREDDATDFDTSEALRENIESLDTGTQQSAALNESMHAMSDGSGDGKKSREKATCFSPIERNMITLPSLSADHASDFWAEASALSRRKRRSGALPRSSRRHSGGSRRRQGSEPRMDECSEASVRKAMGASSAYVRFERGQMIVNPFLWSSVVALMNESAPFMDRVSALKRHRQFKSLPKAFKRDVCALHTEAASFKQYLSDLQKMWQQSDDCRSGEPKRRRKERRLRQCSDDSHSGERKRKRKEAHKIQRLERRMSRMSRITENYERESRTRKQDKDQRLSHSALM